MMFVLIASPGCLHVARTSRPSRSTPRRTPPCARGAQPTRTAGSRVKANAFNLGMMQTGFASVGRAQAAMVKRAMPHRFGDLAKSSDAYARLVVDDALATESANYYDRSTTAVPSSDLYYDEANARELWVECMRLCALR